MSITTITTVGPYTYLAADLVNSAGYFVIRAGAQTGAFTDTLPTASTLISTFVGAASASNNGQSFTFSIYNNTNFNETLLGNTGTTFQTVSNCTLMPQTIVTFTCVQASSTTVTICVVNSGSANSENATLVATTAAFTSVYVNGSNTLTNSGALAAISVDGVSLSLGDRVLVKDQAVPAENGLYSVTTVGSASTNWVLTRTVDYLVPAQINVYAEIPVSAGTVNAGSVWMQTSVVTTIGTSAITFAKYLVMTSLTGDVTSTGPGASAATVSKIGGKNITLGGAFTTSGANALTLTTTGPTNVTLPTSGTILSSTPSALTAVNGTNVTLTLGGTPATALLQAASITAGWTGQLSLTNGGTNASLTASNGGIFYSTAAAGAILSGTATANQILMSGSSAAPAWSTATYPATTTSGQLLFSSAANTVSEVTKVNSAVLTATSAGVPTWVGPLTNGQIVVGSTGATPTASTLTAGNGVVISNAPGAITIAGQIVLGASTANLTATTAGAGVGATLTSTVNAAFVVDGVTYAVGDRTLIKNQTTASQNGIYTVTTVGSVSVPWVLTRATDYDTIAKVFQGSVIPVATGTVNADTTWVQSAVVTVMDTSSISFTKFTAITALTGDVTSSPAAPGSATTTLATVNGNVGTFGSGTQVSQFTVNAKGLITAASNVTITGTSPVGSALTSTNIWVGSAGNVAAAVAVSGDATLSNTGALTLASTAVTAGSYTLANFTVDAKGRLTAASSTAVVLGANGGTGVANTGKTITLGGNLTTTDQVTVGATATANQLMYTSAANNVSGLASVNSAALATSSTGVPTWLGPLTNGQIIMGSTGATPVASTLTAGSGISITNAAGAVTISSTSSNSFYAYGPTSTQSFSTGVSSAITNLGLFNAPVINNPSNFLSFNASTGVITFTSTTAGTYQVSYTVQFSSNGNSYGANSAMVVQLAQNGATVVGSTVGTTFPKSTTTIFANATKTWVVTAVNGDTLALQYGQPTTNTPFSVVANQCTLALEKLF